MQRLFVARPVPMLIVSKQSERCLLGVCLNVLFRCRPSEMKSTACKMALSHCLKYALQMKMSDSLPGPFASSAAKNDLLLERPLVPVKLLLISGRLGLIAPITQSPHAPLLDEAFPSHHHDFRCDVDNCPSPAPKQPRKSLQD